MSAETLLYVEGLTKTYGENVVLDNISTEIKRGEVVAIIGPSGCGKSTFLRSLNQLEKITSGSIYFDGVDMTGSSVNINNVRRRIGMVFQQFNLFPHMTIKENIMFAPVKLKEMTKQEASKRADELLKRVGLLDKADQYPDMLSGGQKQRVAIARALSTNPKYLLCDEATSALDPNTVRSILALLKDINKKLGVTIIVITHEMRVVEQICDRVAVIDGGRVVETGEVKQVFISPKSKMARELILPKNETVESINSERVIRIVFDGQSAFEPVISNIITECRCTVNILGADTKNIDGKAYGQMLLQLPDDEASSERVKNYLGSRKIPFEEVSSK